MDCAERYGGGRKDDGVHFFGRCGLGFICIRNPERFLVNPTSECDIDVGGRRQKKNNSLLQKKVLLRACSVQTTASSPSRNPSKK